MSLLRRPSLQAGDGSQKQPSVIQCVSIVKETSGYLEVIEDIFRRHHSKEKVSSLHSEARPKQDKPNFIKTNFPPTKKELPKYSSPKANMLSVHCKKDVTNCGEAMQISTETNVTDPRWVRTASCSVFQIFGAKLSKQNQPFCSSFCLILLMTSMLTQATSTSLTHRPQSVAHLNNLT